MKFEDGWRTTRRELLAAFGAGAAGACIGMPSVLAADEGFSRQTVLDLARNLSAHPFVRPKAVSETLAGLSYDAYRAIRYRREKAIWHRSSTPFSVQLFAPGYLYRDLIDVSVVESGRAHMLEAGTGSFDVADETVRNALDVVGKFSGFRLHYPVNGNPLDEVVVFQGASYFRAISTGQNYGLSARGLALNVAEPDGEEHPLFRSFWIERPSANDNAILVHALLDSPSVTGAYRFGIYPGRATTMDVEATLFPRTELTHVGLAPLTSMFMHGPVDISDQTDYRPAVHDSQGLAILTGSGEAIWRPLQNPRTLQHSSFMDRSPRGFGLVQRTRDFSAYQDLEADYEKRPSAWVKPQGDWGEGAVVLIEIPSSKETNDNIVAYWRRKDPIPAGERFDFSYRLTWPNDATGYPGWGRVVRSASSHRFSDEMPQFAIDYDTRVPAEAIALNVSASAGTILEALVLDNDQTGGIRVFVTFNPDDAPLSELRVQPTSNGNAIGETWLYRWLAA